MAHDPLLLPHELMKKKDANDPVATGNVDDILHTPYSISGKFVQHPYLLILNARLEPVSSSLPLEPTTTINFNLKDQPKVMIPSSDGTTFYTFVCPINRFTYSSSVLSSRFVPSVIPRGTIPMEIDDRKYFEKEMIDFIGGVIEDAGDKFDVTVDAEASIQRRLWYKTAIKKAESIKEDGRGSTHDCAVCLEEVGMNRYQGVKLHCSHVFHVKCIAPWLMIKDTCPMCRGVQVADNLIRTTTC